MANKGKSKRDYSAGLKALLMNESEPKRTLDYSAREWVIQFCYKCKSPECGKVFPLENGFHTIEPERAQELVAAFAKKFFEEPRTIECPACHHVAEYLPKDVGFDVLEE